MKTVSVIIPVYNEAQNIGSLHDELREVLNTINYPYEIICIDDGSTDGSFNILRQLKPVKIIQFRRNFGQTAAFDAGIKAAQHDYIITMDGDGQNDPHDIPKMINYLESHNFDIVAGWRRNRKDGFMKRFVSNIAGYIRKLMINDNIHDSGCSLKVFRRECLENLNLYGEMHRFIPALLKIKGFKAGEIAVNHRQRKFGYTKYTWHRTIKGLIDIISIWFWHKFSVRPLHLLGGIGLLSIFGGVLAFIWAFISWMHGQSMSDSALPLLVVFLLLSGLQMFIFGLIADTLLKQYYETTRDSSYSIKHVIENE